MTLTIKKVIWMRPKLSVVSLKAISRVYNNKMWKMGMDKDKKYLLLFVAVLSA